MEYNEIREYISEKEHEQWISWSQYTSNNPLKWSKDLEHVLALLESFEGDAKKEAEKYLIKTIKSMKDLIFKWGENWKPYNELTEELKEKDREWADKILDTLPYKCPLHQCGSIMEPVELPFPPGKNEDDFPDGRPGDEQMPDLVCKNCSARYRFIEFKNK